MENSGVTGGGTVGGITVGGGPDPTTIGSDPTLIGSDPTGRQLLQEYKNVIDTDRRICGCDGCVYKLRGKPNEMIKISMMSQAKDVIENH